MKMLFSGILLFVLSFFYAGHAFASAGIAVVDREMIVSKAQVFKSVGKQIDDKRISLQKEFSEKEDQLRKKDEELQHQKSVLAEGMREKKEDEFKQEVFSVRKDAAEKRSQLENVYIASMKKMQGKIREISRIIAEKEGYDLVLFVLKEDQVLYSANGIDISEKVLMALNKEMPDLNINELV